MCFISKFCKGSPALLGSDSYFPQAPPANPNPKEDPSAMTSFENLCLLSPPTPFQGNEQQLLGNLLAIINFNSHLLMKLQQNVNIAFGMLEGTNQAIKESLQQKASFEALPPASGWRTKEPLIEKLFGEKQYKYKLKLRHRLPFLIYKERNINLAVDLLDADDKPVMNSNLINICVACCEVDGRWIPESEQGEYFMQGKTEVELYHGEALFQKLYPRDVSRQFQNGKIGIVIYSKPSLIKFASSASEVEQVVNAEEVEPLLVKDVTIRAKKKNNY